MLVKHEVEQLSEADVRATVTLSYGQNHLHFVKITKTFPIGVSVRDATREASRWINFLANLLDKTDLDHD